MTSKFHRSENGVRPADHAERVARARLSLDGLSVGDAFGEKFFRSDAYLLAERREVPVSSWRVTDDTVMAVSVCEVLDRFGRIDQDALARLFAERYRRQPDRGYGGTAHGILGAIGQGLPWRTAAAIPFGGQGSMGNGGAMRVGPVGAYFADDLDAVVANARASAQVTHAHPDGQAGAIAAAVAAACAWQSRREAATSAGRRLLLTAIELTPDGPTRDGLRKAADLPFDYAVATAVSALGHGSKVIAGDTVPFALWCAARHLDNYEDALWHTVSGFGDIDTNCAIVGSIVVMRTGREGIPAEWLASREPLTM
jgi:ADP-ribosylglycohydrolase